VSRPHGLALQPAAGGAAILAVDPGVRMGDAELEDCGAAAGPVASWFRIVVPHRPNIGRGAVSPDDDSTASAPRNNRSHAR
jgi:hypothetical protein